tara:strand:- start:875 stop:1051 length:177 start_codon:yes stop_codon:yes gene_type:complete
MNYQFAWKTIENGVIQGVHEQTIFGETLAHACTYFEGFHGAIDETLEITSIKTTESNQ